MAQAGQQRHGAALRKAGDHDAAGGNAAGLFIRDHGLDGGLRAAQAGGVFLHVEIGPGNVEPRRHLVAVVQRDRNHRRVGEHEAHRAHGRQVEFAGNRHEVVAVGTQAVHQDHRGGGVRGGFDFDGGTGHGQRRYSGMRMPRP